MKSKKFINILIVDDNIYNLLILNHYLKSNEIFNFKIHEVKLKFNNKILFNINIP